VAAVDAAESADLTTVDIVTIDKCLYSIVEADSSGLTGSNGIRDRSYTCGALCLIK
jgi:hypothetical protein